MKHEEDNLQSMCVRWFRTQFPKLILFAIPNGARTSISVAVRLKATGLLKGVPDLFLAHQSGEYGGLFIEMKSAKGRPTREQNDMKVKLQSEGYKVVLCRTFEEFKDGILSYIICLANND